MKELAREAAIVLQTLGAGLIGGWLFSLAGMPVPWLSGPMTAVAALAMAGRPLLLPDTLKEAGLLVAGVAMGSSVTPDALETIARYPLSLIFLAVSMTATVLLSQAVLERGFGWDRSTAFFSSIPGALSMVIALASASQGDIRRVAMVQAVRLFALVGAMPLLLVSALPVAAAAAQPVVTAGGLAVIFALSFALAGVLGLLRAINPLFLGGMISATVLHAADIVPGALPDPIVGAGFLLVGVFCGIRFEGATLRLLLGVMTPALASLACGLGLALVFSLAVHRLTGLGFAEVLIAFAPGGVEAMILVGAALGLDTLYISTHHVARALALNAVTPLVAPFATRLR